MTETDWPQASKPIPPFGFHQNDTSVNTARAEHPKSAEPNTQSCQTRSLKAKPLKTKALKTEATETKVIEAGTLETLRSLSKQSSASTIAIDDSDQPASAQPTVITPTSERFSEARGTGHEDSAEPIPAESSSTSSISAGTVPAALTLAVTTEPEATESKATESKATESETTPEALLTLEALPTPEILPTPETLPTPEEESLEVVRTSSVLTNVVENAVVTSAPPLTTETPQAFEPPLEESSAPPLYFLVVNYHNAALISDLLHTLEANQGIVLVNNSPIDRVVHKLAGQTYASGMVTVLDAPDNMGFGAACNLGLEWIYARSPNALVWLIKSDAQLVPRAVASVRQCFTQRPDLAILGTPILNASGKPWFAAGTFNPWLGLITSQRLGKADVLGRPIPTRWVSSGSMIFNFAVLGHCPQFDETYFLYYEDCDLCERYFQQGAAIALTPSPLIVRSGTTALSRYTYPRHTNAAFSRLTFLSRHGTPIALGLNLLVLSAKALLLKIRYRTASEACWQGIQRFLNLPGR